MKELNLTKKELDSFKIFNKGGFEGEILVYDKNLLIKAFLPYLSSIIDIKRKKLKLIRLHEKNIDGRMLIHPKKLINVDGEFTGYTMEKINDGITLDSISDYKKLVSFYRILFDKLEVLHKNNIIVHDVKHDNIVIENDNPVFIDVDSMGIDEYNYDHENYRSTLTKNIPNFNEKRKKNNDRELDKLKLLTCFIYSINQEPSNIYQRLNNSQLSPDFKKEIKRIFTTDNELKIGTNINELLIIEENKIGRRK